MRYLIKIIMGDKNWIKKKKVYVLSVASVMKIVGKSVAT